MGKLRPFVQKESYMPNKKWIPFVIGNGYTTVDGASGPAPEWDTAIGNPVSFNALAPWPLRQLKVAFSPVQSGSGDPSPDNVRPISGWSSLTVEQRGRNLFDASQVQYGYWLSNTWHENNVWCGILIPCEPGTKISVSGNPTQGGVSSVWLNQWNDCTIGLVANTGGYVGVTTFTAPAGAYGFWLPLYKNDDWSELQIEYADAPTTYEAPNIRSISINLGQTVYSGYVDVISGVGEITWAATVIKDIPSGYFTLSQSGLLSMGGGYTERVFPDMVRPATSLDVVQMICSMSKAIASNNISWLPQFNGNFAFNSGGVFYLCDTSCTTIAEYLTKYADAQFVYPLATPIPIQLTPQEVSSLLGDNVLFSDANGDLTVEYRSN